MSSVSASPTRSTSSVPSTAAFTNGVWICRGRGTRVMKCITPAQRSSHGDASGSRGGKLKVVRSSSRSTVCTSSASCTAARPRGPTRMRSPGQSVSSPSTARHWGRPAAAEPSRVAPPRSTSTGPCTESTLATQGLQVSAWAKAPRRQTHTAIATHARPHAPRATNPPPPRRISAAPILMACRVTAASALFAPPCGRGVKSRLPGRAQRGAHP